MFQSSIQYCSQNSLCCLVQARQNEPSSILVQDNVYVFLDFVFASAFQDWLFWQYRQRSFINVSYRLRTSNPVFGIAAVNDSSVGHYMISIQTAQVDILWSGIMNEIDLTLTMHGIMRLNIQIVGKACWISVFFFVTDWNSAAWNFCGRYWGLIKV